MTFYERYQALCHERGIQPTSQSSADALGCSKSNISMLSKSGKTPSGEIVANAAKMLNVSADYLLGLTDTPSPLETITTLDPEEEFIIRNLRNLNSNAMLAVKTMITGLSNEPTFKKD